MPIRTYKRHFSLISNLYVCVGYPARRGPRAHPRHWHLNGRPQDGHHPSSRSKAGYHECHPRCGQVSGLLWQRTADERAGQDAPCRDLLHARAWEGLPRGSYQNLHPGKEDSHTLNLLQPTHSSLRQTLTSLLFNTIFPREYSFL